MPYVIGQQRTFPSVQCKDDILTEDLLDAATCATNIVGSMGAQFSMTKDDMLGNIKKIRAKYETNKEKFKKLRDLLQDEVDNKENKNDKSGTVGGLWLKRGLEYLCEVFWELIKEHTGCRQPGGKKSDSGAVKAACSSAYERTLKHHHNMAAKILVKGGLMVSPYKETLMDNLRGSEQCQQGDQNHHDVICDEMKIYEEALRAFVVVLEDLYEEFGYDGKYKIGAIHA